MPIKILRQKHRVGIYFLIILFFYFFTLNDSPAENLSKRVWVKNFSINKNEVIVKFKMRFKNGIVQSFQNIPSGWQVCIDNWGEEDQLHWTGSLTGEAGHVSGALDVKDLMNSWVVMEAYDSDFDVSMEISIYGYEKGETRVLKLKKNMFSITSAAEDGKPK